MQLSIALGLHFGWGSQLNTSEIFWTDISRWMISSICRWILVYLFWRTAHDFEPLPFFCSIVSIGLRPQSCQLPICNLFTLHSCLSSFGRETSLVNIMGPRSIFPPLFTSCFYFLDVAIIIFYLLCLVLDLIMSLLTKQAPIDPHDVPLNSLVAQEQVDVNFISRNNFNNNAYRS